MPDLIISPWRGAVGTQIMDGEHGSRTRQRVSVRLDAPWRACAWRPLIIIADGVTDLMLAMGPGGGEVAIVDGRTARGLVAGHPFGTSFAGGVSLAVGDVNADGSNDIVMGQASNGGSVSVLDGQTYDLLFTVVPFGASYGGSVFVACDDADGDGRADILVGQAAGGAVTLVDGASGRISLTATVFPGANGVFVAMGDVNDDGAAELMAAPGNAGGPVLVYDLRAAALLAAFTPVQTFSAGGVHIVASDITGDGRADIGDGPWK